MRPLIFKSLFIVLALLSKEATSYAQRAQIDSLTKAVDTAPDSIKADIYYHIGKDFLRISPDSCKMYIDLSLDYCEQFDDKQYEAECYSVLGALEKYQGHYEEALTYHLKSLKLKEGSDNWYGLAVTYNDIGIVYKQMKRWREALGYYKKSNQAALKANLVYAISFTYNNQGTVYNELGKRDSAMNSYDSALHYAELSKSTGAMATALANIADVNIADKKYDKALASFTKCLYYDKLNEDKYGMALSHMELARCYDALGQPKKALAHIDSSERLAQENNLRRERIDILTIRSAIEEHVGLSSAAILHIRQATALKDSILNSETSKQISELQTKYETEKKEQQIVLQQEQLSKKNYAIGGISALLVLIILLGISYYNRYKLRQQDKLQKAIIHQQELATKAVIEAEEKERKRIAGDLHDGVGQTMSAASMNLSVISNEIPFANEEQRSAFEKARSLVDDGCKEVRSVSHAIMPNALLKSGLATAIREFLNKIDSKVLKVNVYAEGLNERLPSNIETVLYRVVQECVNNTIKHAQANTLDLSLIKDEDGISITIEDNGKGFDLNTLKKKDGIGIQNLQTRIGYLNGTIEWDTAPDKGTVVSIHIP